MTHLDVAGRSWPGERLAWGDASHEGVVEARDVGEVEAFVGGGRQPCVVPVVVFSRAGAIPTVDNARCLEELLVGEEVKSFGEGARPFRVRGREVKAKVVIGRVGDQVDAWLHRDAPEPGHPVVALLRGLFKPHLELVEDAVPAKLDVHVVVRWRRGGVRVRAAAIREEARATLGGEVVHERGLHGEAVLERRGHRAPLGVAARQLERVRDDLGVLFWRGVTRRGAPREAGCQAERVYGQRV